MLKTAILFLFFIGFLQAQNKDMFVDDKYLEDQLYFNLTYVQLLNTPDPIDQSGFSFGVGLGFIKDFPLNKRRNIALGAGLGYGFTNYYFNIRLDEIVPPIEKSTLNNKINIHTAELPLELRFRGSTTSKYKFWRFYPGFKIAYIFANKTSSDKAYDYDIRDIVEINQFIYGLTFSAGYNKWNLHVYYGLNDLLNNTPNNPYDINVNDIRLGLIFYIF